MLNERNYFIYRKLKLAKKGQHGWFSKLMNEALFLRLNKVYDEKDQLKSEWKKLQIETKKLVRKRRLIEETLKNDYGIDDLDSIN